MSIHSSLSKGSAGSSHRSVIKRHEKIQRLKEKGLWDDSKGVLALPKIKMIKIKAKKEKPKAEGETAPGTDAAAGAAKAPAAGSKAAPNAKAAADKKS